MKVLTLRKRAIVIGLCVLLCVAGVVIYFTAIRPTFQPKPQYTIVIDAGHGGKDGGAVGAVSGVTESFLNLEYAQELEKICKEFGFKVVMTRSDMNGLYSETASNKKKSEMAKRKEIIEKSNADLVVSIHMNSFPSSSARGSQVFYGEGNEAGQFLAENVSTILNKNFDYAKKTAKVGDYYVLNCTDKPAILVECGFLSNSEEEALLQDEDYKERFCYNLLCGILNYFRM